MAVLAADGGLCYLACVPRKRYLARRESRCGSLSAQAAVLWHKQRQGGCVSDAS